MPIELATALCVIPSSPKARPSPSRRVRTDGERGASSSSRPPRLFAMCDGNFTRASVDILPSPGDPSERFVRKGGRLAREFGARWLSLLRLPYNWKRFRAT